MVACTVDLTKEINLCATANPTTPLLPISAASLTAAACNFPFISAALATPAAFISAAAVTAAAFILAISI